MANKGQSGDVMDSVFDFIFTESKKTPAKVKPVTVTGLDSIDPYVDVATAVLEKPLMYVNKTTERAIQDVFNIEINKFNIDTKDGKASVNFGTGNIIDVLNNDLKFVDNAFNKLETARKAGRMTAWGKEIAAFTAAGMAMQMGLDAETRDAFLKVGKSDTDPNARYEMNARSIHLASKSWKERDYQNLSLDSLKAIYGEERGAKVYKNIQAIHSKYEAEMGKPEGQRDFSNVFNEAGANRDMHLFFEKFNFAKKEAEARNKAATLDPNSKEAIKLNRQARGYRDAQNTLTIIHDSDRYKKHGGIDKYVIQKEVELRTLKEELRNLSGATDRASIDRLRDIKGEIRGIDVQVRNFKIQKTAHSLGMIETQLVSIKQLYEYTVGGGLVPALINGDFFDARKNVAWGLQPRDGGSSVKLAQLGSDGKLITREYKGILAKSGKDRFEQAYYEGMMDFYYRFTPKGIIENLTTGNGFARQAFKQREGLIEMFKNSAAGKLFADGDIEWDKLFSPAGPAYLKSLEGNPKFAKLLEYIENNKGKFDKYNKLVKTANSFNFIQRFKDNLAKNSLYKKTIGAATDKLKQKFGELLMKIAKEQAAKDTINSWLAGNLGVSVAIKSAIKSALATYTGGASAAFGFIIDRAVDFAMHIATKMAKPVVKTAISGFVFALVGLLGIGYLIITAPSKVMKTLGSYSHVAPHEIKLGETDYVVPIEGDPGLPGETVPGVSFPIYSGGAYDILMSIASEFGVSVSLHDCTGSTEGYCGKIAGGWCYAAQGTVYCDMSRIPESAYNTIFRHEVMHFVQVWYFDYQTDRKYREWGADYMSNNGGWYCVVVNGVSMRATTAAEIFKREGGCTEEDLINLAYRKADSADPNCAAYFHSSLTSAETGYCN